MLCTYVMFSTSKFLTRLLSIKCDFCTASSQLPPTGSATHCPNKITFGMYVLETIVYSRQMIF